jgi:hypothetical protein
MSSTGEHTTDLTVRSFIRGVKAPPKLRHRPGDMGQGATQGPNWPDRTLRSLPGIADGPESEVDDYVSSGVLDRFFEKHDRSSG